MITTCKAKIEDTLNIVPQKEQLNEISCVVNSIKVYDWLTIKNEFDEPLVLFTFLPQSDCNVRLFAIVSENITKYSFVCVKTLNKYIEYYLSKYDRIECTVKTSFKEGHRLMRILKFDKECDMPFYFNKETHSLYRRLK